MVRLQPRFFFHLVSTQDGANVKAGGRTPTILSGDEFQNNITQPPRFGLALFFTNVGRGKSSVEPHHSLKRRKRNRGSLIAAKIPARRTLKY